MATKDEQKLSNFANELEGLLKDYRSNQVLDQQTKSHQKTLEKLLTQTNKIMEGNASDQDHEQFDELVKYSKRSYKEVEKQNRNNEEFQEAFQKKFGDEVGAGSLNRRLVDKLSTNLTEVASSVNVLNSNAAQDVSDTALNFATGPFGAMIKESLDLSGITGYIKKKFAGDDSNKEMEKPDTSSPRRVDEDTARKKVKPTIVERIKDTKESSKETVFKSKDEKTGVRGQFDAGIDRVPQRGTYLLDKNERVIPPEQNKDLTQFLGTMQDVMKDGDQGEGQQPEKDRVVRIFNQSSSDDYWSPLKNHQSQLHEETINTMEATNRKTVRGLNWIRETMKQETLDQIDAWMQSFSIFYQRFARHPVLNTLRLAMRPLGFVMSKIGQFLFGKKKSDTDRIVESNEEIVDFLRKGFSESKKTLFQRGVKGAGRGLLSLGSRAIGQGRVQTAQELEDKRAQGKSLGSGKISQFFNERRLDKAQPYVTQRTFGSSGGGEVGGSSQRKSSILAGDEMREQDAMEEAVIESWHTLEEIKELLEGYKGLGPGEAEGSGSKGGMLSSIKGFLSKALTFGAGVAVAKGGAILTASKKLVTSLFSSIAGGFARLGIGTVLRTALMGVGFWGLIAGALAYGLYKALDWTGIADTARKRSLELLNMSDEERQEKAKKESEGILSRSQRATFIGRNPDAFNREQQKQFMQTGKLPSEDVKDKYREYRKEKGLPVANDRPEASANSQNVHAEMNPTDDRALEEQKKTNAFQEQSNTLLEEVKAQLQILNKTAKETGGVSTKGEKGPPAQPSTKNVAEGN